ncbi:malate:quinone oxidoreductase [Kocuria rhizophila]|nr:malate:quinone oxidoreductase [Kocuria rhizophila]
MAATFAPEGTDVDFGALADQLLDHLRGRDVSVQYGQQVTTLKRQSDGCVAGVRGGPSRRRTTTA